MDGNLRWSKKHKITAQKGYIQGLNKINEIIDICLEKKIKLPTLKRIIMAGAPVSGKLLRRFENIVNVDCKIQTPYGATEALPVSLIDRQEILDQSWPLSNKGAGTCVGKAIPGVEIKIIA